MATSNRSQGSSRSRSRSTSSRGGSSRSSSSSGGRSGSSGRSSRGFAGMDREEHREISRRGGEASGGNLENLRNQGGSGESGSLRSSGGDVDELRSQGNWRGEELVIEKEEEE